MSWCLRFISNCRSAHNARNHSTKLSLEEIQSTEARLLKLSQRCSFKTDYDSLLTSGKVSTRSCLIHLRPYLNKEGLICVGSHLEKSALTVRQMHPIILHHTDHLPKLIGRQLHVDNLHAALRPCLLLFLCSITSWVQRISRRVSLERVFAANKSTLGPARNRSVSYLQIE